MLNLLKHKNFYNLVKPKAQSSYCCCRQEMVKWKCRPEAPGHIKLSCLGLQKVMKNLMKSENEKWDLLEVLLVSSWFWSGDYFVMKKKKRETSMKCILFCRGIIKVCVLLFRSSSSSSCDPWGNVSLKIIIQENLILLMKWSEIRREAQVAEVISFFSSIQMSIYVCISTFLRLSLHSICSKILQLICTTVLKKLLWELRSIPLVLLKLIQTNMC